MHPMKIVLVHNYYPVIGGGEDSVVEEERRMLEGAGHSIVPFFMYTKERGFLDFVYSALCLIWNPVAYRRMRRMIRAEQPDIVHCHNTFPLISPSVYWACRKEGVPVVQTLHNYRMVCANGLFLRNGGPCEDCSGRRFGWPAIRYRCYRNSIIGSTMLATLQWVHRLLGTWINGVTRYISLTDFAKSRFVKSGMIPAEQISVKPNFIQDVPPLEPQKPRQKQAVFIGRLWPEKGCLLLVDAWIRAFKQSNGLGGYELLIIGDGPQRKEAEALCNGCSKDYGICFLGVLPRREVLEILQSVRFLVLPSIWYEGFPMTIVEAFACGTPVLSAGIGSMSSIIEENITGIFFDAGNNIQLAERIVWAASNAGAMDEMGRHARRTYEELYVPEVNLSELMDTYDCCRGFGES